MEYVRNICNAHTTLMSNTISIYIYTLSYPFPTNKNNNNKMETGALLRCSDLLRSKNLRVVGLDPNEYYVDAARRSISEAGMDRCIAVMCMSVYDERRLNRLGGLLDDMIGGGDGGGGGGDD